MQGILEYTGKLIIFCEIQVMLPVKVEVLGISSMWLFCQKLICGLISLIISVVGAGNSGSICW